LEKEYGVEIRMLGTCMAAVYEGATCLRGCHGGSHVVERLCGRTYNLATSAYLLIERGFYDEALNLIRSIGEIGNLFMLFSTEPGAMQKWLDADRRTRLKEFSPYQVRLRLEKAGGGVIPADEDWYAELCDAYTHATPTVQPNMHNDEKRSLAGGAFQEEGLKKCLQQLINQLGVIALTASAVFKFLDHQEALFQLTGELNGRAKTS
jgi:hypothetical protein